MPSSQNLLLKVLETYYLTKTGYFTWDIHPFCALSTSFKWEEKGNGVFPIKQQPFVFFIYVVSQWASESDSIQTRPQGHEKQDKVTFWDLAVNYYLLYSQPSFLFNLRRTFGPTAASPASRCDAWDLFMRTGFCCNTSRLKLNPSCTGDAIQRILQMFARMVFRQRSRNQTVYFPLWAVGNSDHALPCVINTPAFGLLYLPPNRKQTLLLWRVSHATDDNKKRRGKKKKTRKNKKARAIIRTICAQRGLESFV